MAIKFPLTFQKASYAKYLVGVESMTQTQAAIMLELNQGSVSHVIHGRRFPFAPPVAPPGFEPKE
jgi:predicted transcriptional regulator